MEDSEMTSKKNTTVASEVSPSGGGNLAALESWVYMSDWKSARAYRQHVTDVLSGRGSETGRAGAGFADLRRSVADDEDGHETPENDPLVPTPGRIAARLLLARLFDRHPDVLVRFGTTSAVVVVDVPDAGLHDRIVRNWEQVLRLESSNLIDIGKLSDRTRRDRHFGIHVIVKEPLTPKTRPSADEKAFGAVQFALPILAITPGAESHLSKVLVDAATDRLTLPPIDADVIRKVVRIVTGGRCTTMLPDDIVARIGLRELLMAVRFDRSPAECIDIMVGLAQAKITKLGSRDISLDELHGLDEAVDWARSTIRDVESWKRGEVGWDEAIDAGIVLDGPPGTGKTLFAKVFSESLGIPMVSATLAKWQGSGDGHLGHLLRAMKKDFDDARAQAPAIFFCDEIDSFADRAGITHSHKDYVVEVVNAFIEQLDGLNGRQGLIFIGACNDVHRCDPAIVRSGRLNRIIRIGLPTPETIEKMMRVRLRGDLRDESIEELSLLATGSTGADIERIVKDARRFARQQERPLTLADMRQALLGTGNELSPQMIDRVAAHEAGHIIVSVLHDGPADIHAVVAGTRRAPGFVASKRAHEAGTLAEWRRELQGLLAGRAAEELVFGTAGAGDGSGGSRSSDLALASRIAASLVGSLGHSGPHPLLFLADAHETDVILDKSYMRAAAHEELASAFREASSMLGAHRAALAEVALRLRTKGRIDGHEVAAVLNISAPAARDVTRAARQP
jgi:cell division protease FtsH